MRDQVLRRHAVRISGNQSGTPMLFAHGFGCDQTLWRFVAPAFEDDFRVVTFDYVGAGDSDRSAYDSERYGSLDGYARDILEICRSLDLQGVILVAHSVSAMIAILASIEEPQRFQDLVLVTPSPRYMDDLPDYRGGFGKEDIDELLKMMDMNSTGWAAFLAPVVMANADRPELSSDLEATFCSIDPVMAREFAQVTFMGDNREDLPSVSVPTLILQSANDAVAPMEVGRYLNANLTRSTLHVIDSTGHCPHVSHPQETIDAIREYVEQRRRVAQHTET